MSNHKGCLLFALRTWSPGLGGTLVLYVRVPDESRRKEERKRKSYLSLLIWGRGEMRVRRSAVELLACEAASEGEEGAIPHHRDGRQYSAK